jgi:hypothetical protein
MPVSDDPEDIDTTVVGLDEQLLQDPACLTAQECGAKMRLPITRIPALVCERQELRERRYLLRRSNQRRGTVRGY